MSRKLIFTLCLTALTAIGLTGLLHWSPRTAASLAVSRAYEMELSQEYELKFIPDKTPAGNMSEYIPRYRPSDMETVNLYGGLFGMHSGFGEDDDSFWLEDDQGKLLIDKYINHIRYEAVPTKERTTPLPSDEEAIDLALHYFESKLLQISYEEALVQFDGQQYEVSFITRLGNIKNYAFDDKIVMDRCGNVQTLDYHYIVYDKLNNTPIKAMVDAYYELPVGLFEDQTVDLKNGQLVYIYENSIVQPAYLFEGEVTGGTPTSFQCFVKASVYDRYE